MSYQVIARKWRPQTFEEVTGQESITQTLRNAIEHDRLHHAYLFSGARGVGKTTTARLLAKALNCHKTSVPNPKPCAPAEPDACPSCREIAESRSIDVFEFDAASHTKVEEIRDIVLEGINIAPARDRFKVFIIDEVHMLSTSSFNALLKTLEEPPPNVVFIMATTELHKVPITILSRCQEFEFRTIALTRIFERLQLIANAEKIEITDEALREIARSGEGSMRDAQSNFDQVISFSGDKIEAPDVANALGLASTEMLVRIVTAIAHNKPAEALNVVGELVSRGHDLRNYCRDLLAFFRDLLVAKIAGADEMLLETSIIPPDELKKYAHHFSESDLIRFFHSLSETEARLREAAQSRFMLEVGLMKLVEMRRLVPIETMLERLAKLEESLTGAVPAGDGETSPTAEKKTLKSAEPPPDVPFPTSVARDIPEDRTVSESHSPHPAAAAENEQSAAKSRIEEPDRDNPPEPPPHFHEAPTVEEFRKVRGNYDFVAAMPVKMPPISAEDLEHFDDDKLDAAFETRLRREGDNLRRIKTAPALADSLIGERHDAALSMSADVPGSVQSLRKPAFEVPEYEDYETAGPPPELPENPTDAQLLEYAKSHPAVKRVLRAFRGTIVEVRKS